MQTSPCLIVPEIKKKSIVLWIKFKRSIAAHHQAMEVGKPDLAALGDNPRELPVRLDLGPAVSAYPPAYQDPAVLVRSEKKRRPGQGSLA